MQEALECLGMSTTWHDESRGRLFLTVPADEVLRLPLPNPLGLVPGNILVLRLVRQWCSLRLDNLRDVYSPVWRERATPGHHGWLERIFCRPPTGYTSVTAGGAVPIDGGLFPIYRGERYVLIALDCGTQRAFYLERSEAAW